MWDSIQGPNAIDNKLATVPTKFSSHNCIRKYILECMCMYISVF